MSPTKRHKDLRRQIKYDNPIELSDQEWLWQCREESTTGDPLHLSSTCLALNQLNVKASFM